MDFTIGQSSFKQALGRAQGVVDKRNTVPLLANVLLEVTDGQLRITASDMEVAFSGQIPVSSKKPGALCVPAKQLNDIIRQLPEADVHLRALPNDWLEIRCQDAYFKIMGLGTEGFPGIPEVEAIANFTLKGADLAAMIEGVFFSIATDDSRYGLNGAFLEVVQQDEDVLLRMVSTDGHRLSMINRVLPEEIPIRGGYLLPRKGLGELRKICDEAGGDEVRVDLSEGSGLFTWHGIAFFMRFLEGEFPPYQQVIPRQHVRTATLKREELTNALRRVSILSSEKTHSVRFILKEDTLELSASSQDLGESREVIPARIEGEPLSIGFNARYFLDALTVLREDEVVLELGEHLHPALLRGERDRLAIYVVMPMRLE